MYKFSRYFSFPIYILVGKFFRKIVDTSIEVFTVPKLHKKFRHLPFASHAMQKLLSCYKFKTILDIGSGEGAHAKVFADHGKLVTTLDYGDSIYYKKAKPDEVKTFKSIVADFNEYTFKDQYDAVWCSHVLEHQLNPNHFLLKVSSVLKNGGVLAITVPPARNTMVGGHVSNWNAGLVLYHLVLAGFDCSEARILKYGYNISVLVKKKPVINENLSFDSGDLRKINKFLPKRNYIQTYNDDLFYGNIWKLNW